MKILLSAYACEPNRGSEEGFGWNWATHLAREGHRVWVITRPHTQHLIKEEVAKAPVPGLHFHYVDIPAHYKSILKGQLGVYLHYFIWQREIFAHARQIAEDQSVDLVHHVTWGSLIGGSRLWKIGKPFVFGPVGGGQVASPAFKEYFYNDWRQESIRTYITRHVLPKHPLTRKMLRHTDLLLATNSDTLSIARDMGARNAALFLDTGLPDHYFANHHKEVPHSECMNILWVGRLLDRKALRLSLETVAQLEFPFKMTILGNGPQDALVPQWIDELGLDDKVHWRGRVPWSEVQQALKDHEIFLFTSLRDSFGSQLLEAMSNGLVVVTLDHHGAHDFVPDNCGIRVPVSDPASTIKELAQALTSLYGETQRLQAMSAAALAFARQNEWSLKAARMTELYRSVLHLDGEPVLK